MSQSGQSPSPALRPALLTTAVLMIAVGVGIALIGGQTVLGLAIAGFGVIDLLTLPLVLRTVQGARSRAATEPSEPGTEPEQAPPDPDYNPYARED